MERNGVEMSLQIFRAAKEVTAGCGVHKRDPQFMLIYGVFLLL